MKSVRRRVPESSWVRAGQWACLVMSLVSLPTWAGPPFQLRYPIPMDSWATPNGKISQAVLLLSEAHDFSPTKVNCRRHPRTGSPGQDQPFGPTSQVSAVSFSADIHLVSELIGQI